MEASRNAGGTEHMRHGHRRAGQITLVATLAVTVTFGILPALAAVGMPSGTSTVTGVVQEIVVDDRRHYATGPDEQTRLVLRVGDDVVPLAEGSLPVAESGETVRATLGPAEDGARPVLSSTTVAEAPAQTSQPAGPTTMAAGSEVHDVHAVIVRPLGMSEAEAPSVPAVEATIIKASGVLVRPDRRPDRLPAGRWTTRRRAGGGAELRIRVPL